MVKSKKIVEINDNKVLYIADIKDTDFKIWDKNRFTDQKRVEELIELLKNYKCVPGIISVFRENGNYFIYDGAHRYLAAKQLNIPLKIIYSQLIVTSPEILKNDFININKSVPVPEMYLEESKKKETCKNIVMYLVNKYPDFKSSSRNSRSPNFNQDTLSDILYQILPEKCSSDEVINSIYNVNLLIKKQQDTKCPKKCIERDFYLFTVKNWDNLLVSDLKKEVNLIEF
jgi:hypothetical protein